ncbi:hypothetical protein F4802DRAFT_542002 [Xylaria palmicola]|nr:hypothetical protein F4802DRAFT_542002 [Xylaria palmicola]
MATQAAAPQDVADFLKLLGMLVADPSTTWVNHVLQDNQQMKATVRQKEAESNGFIQALAKVSQDLKTEVDKSKRAITESREAKTKAAELVTAIEGANQTIADKEQKLQKDAATITNLQGNIDSLDKEVKSRDDIIRKQGEAQANNGARIRELEGSLGTTQSELNAKSNQLRELQDLSCEVVDQSKDFVLDEIDKIYDLAKAVAVKYFSEDLPEDIVANTPLFESIQRIVKPIPFPPSNSIAAKKARIAAFLSTLGSQLVNQIFLPFYELPDEDLESQNNIDSITSLLSYLSHTDPKREAHIRSVLLAISPNEQKRVAYDRADDIADLLNENLGILLSSDRMQAFDNDVKILCHRAVESWDTLRCLKEKVEPYTQTDEETEKYWLPAEFDGGSQNKKQANGKPNGLASKPSMHSLKSANKIRLVWPGFSYGSEVLKQGFMLLESQVKFTDEETQPLKRNLRAMQRAQTSSPVQGRRSSARKSKLFPRSGD